MYGKQDEGGGGDVKITAAHIEIAVARHFGYRQHLIVPNVSWGMGLHECDVLILSSLGYATEVEIKISASDLKKDTRKRHGHVDSQNRIKKLYFAIPEKLMDYADAIPERAGILVYKYFNGRGYVEEIRPARQNMRARPLTDDERYNMARLGAMRIWSLKQKIMTLQERDK